MDILQKRTWAQIDLDAAAHNFKEIRRYVGNRSMVCCVIKADAYGHGAVRMAEEYEALGADWLALSNIEEALQVRRAGIKLPLLVLGYTPAEAADVLAENDIAQCAYSAEYCAALSENAVKSGVKVKIHVKVDTGMSRLGFYFQDIERDKEAVSVVAEACRRPGLIPEGIFTHFAVADGGENGKAFTLKQFSCFMALIAELEKQGVTFKIHHCANSGAILDYPEMHLDMVRAGVILYGMEPSLSVEHHADFRPVLSLHSVISHVKEIEPGSDISYDRTFTAKGRMRVATIPVGYGDGYPRSLSNKGYVLIHGKKAPIRGRVCMDQFMVDVTDIPDVKFGDKVTLVGKDGDEFLPVETLSDLSGRFNYEFVCDLGKRIPREYIQNGQVIEQVDYFDV